MGKLLRAQTRDDRGRPVDVVDVHRLRREAEDRASPRYQLALRLRAAMKGSARNFSWPAALLTGISSVAAVAILFIAPSGFRLFSFALVCVAGGILVRNSVRARLATNLAASAVAEGVCGTCTYPLHGLEPEADGCLVCSECGSAWRAARVVRAEDAPAYRPYRPPLPQRLLFRYPKDETLLFPDDRGRFVRSLDSRLRLLSPERRAEMGHAAVRALVSELRRRGAVLRVCCALPFVALAGLLLWYLLQRAGPLRWSNYTLVSMLIGFTLAITPFIAIWRSDLGLEPRKIRGVLLAHARCPACARSLIGAKETESFLVCPECAASWKAVDVRTPGSEADAARARQS